MRLAALVGLAVMIAAAPAHAAVVRTSVATDCDDVNCWGWRVVDVEAAPGERNALELRDTATTVILRDRGAPLRATGDCRRDAAGTVTCPLTLPPETDAERTTLPIVAIDTGDGDDRVAMAGGSRERIGVQVTLGTGSDAARMGRGATVDGGAGNDRIVIRGGTVRGPDGAASGGGGWAIGGDGDDVLIATGSHAFLEAQAGDDILRGGGGDDVLAPGLGHDRVSGGGGRDELLYTLTGAVHVDLPSGRGWTPGGEVRLSGVENVTTGPGNDVLIGNHAGNRLIGGPGANRINAGGGADAIQDPAPGSGCGSGRDTVLVPSPEMDEPGTYAALHAPVPVDCERIHAGVRSAISVRFDARPLVDAQRVTFTGVRRRITDGIGWELRAGRSDASPLLGRSEAGDTATVTIELNRRGGVCVAQLSCTAWLTLTERPDEEAIDAAVERTLPLPLLLVARAGSP